MDDPAIQWVTPVEVPRTASTRVGSVRALARCARSVCRRRDSERRPPRHYSSIRRCRARSRSVMKARSIDAPRPTCAVRCSRTDARCCLRCPRIRRQRLGSVRLEQQQLESTGRGASARESALWIAIGLVVALSAVSVWTAAADLSRDAPGAAQFAGCAWLGTTAVVHDAA